MSRTSWRKLFEELPTKEEGLKTENKLIYMGKPLNLTEVHFLSELKRKLERQQIDERLMAKIGFSQLTQTYL